MRFGKRWVFYSFAMTALTAALIAVGGRGSSPSGGYSHPATAHSETAPARTPRPPLVGGGTDGVGELADPPSSGVIPDDGASARAGSSPAPVSTVTQALTATAPAYTVIDAVPATPAATARLPPPATAGTANEAEARAWIAVYFPASEQATAVRVASCETGGTFDPTKVGRAGEQGIFQVMARFWGTVPADIEGQVRQAAGIVAGHGWTPWSCY